jgi:hypothetical protein
MAIVNIPVQQNQSAWSQRTTLDGRDYALDFAWNARGGAWYLSISDTFGNALLTGIKLVSNRPLLARFRFVVGLPPGDFMAASLDGKTDYAQYGELGSTIPLYYFEAADIGRAVV